MDSTGIVTHFLDRWSVSLDGIRAALRDTLSPDGVWDNVGLALTHGPDEAIAFIDNFVAQTGFSRMGYDMVNMCAKDRMVFTERVDRFFDAQDKEFLAVRVNGVFELNADGKITSWRDYFDTKALG